MNRYGNDFEQWPTELSIVRHGQSAGNVARDLAEEKGLAAIDIQSRDMDVPLSDLGKEQATSLGQWFKSQDPSRRPTVIIASPYLRAMQTAENILNQLEQPGLKLHLDERLREREFGVIDRLTKKGITEKFPDQAELYARLRKFYYRPPGGESWCDVILRLRSFEDTLAREYYGQRVLVVCHSVVVLCFRYLLERMTEQEILKIDKENEIANCSLTSYSFDPKRKSAERLTLEKFNFVSPLEISNTPVTHQPISQSVTSK